MEQKHVRRWSEHRLHKIQKMIHCWICYFVRRDNRVLRNRLSLREAMRSVSGSQSKCPSLLEEGQRHREQHRTID